jgi:hypothetical protein
VLKISKKILFTKTMDISDAYFPYPTKKNLPEWYKEANTFFDNSSVLGKMTSHTIKKCIPVFDAMSAGYIITTFCDIYISHKEIKNVEENKKIPVPKIVPADERYNTIEFHNLKQLQNHPLSKNQDAPKFMNPWGIETPKGYSCLFVNPMHNKNSIFTILEGIVDTDTYTLPVNFPFIFNDASFVGLIPAGTPIAQVIPFKRDSWSMEISEDCRLMNTNRNDLSSLLVNKYKKIFWSKKEYN